MLKVFFNEYINFYTNEHIEVKNNKRTIWGLSVGIGTLSIAETSALPTKQIEVSTEETEILNLCPVIVSGISYQTGNFFYFLM